MMKMLVCMLLGMAVTAIVRAELPDAKHAWGTEDANRPRPFAVAAEPGAYPSDAILVKDPSKVPATLAGDCQLHFAVKGDAKLRLFGVNTLDGVVAHAGSDGWIVYDVVFHRPGEGHPGILTVLVNGLFAKDVSVEKADGKTPLELSGNELCNVWIRSTPAPWTDKDSGRYVDEKVVQAKRAATAARLFVGYKGMTPAPKQKPEAFQTRKTATMFRIYGICSEEPYASAYKVEHAKFLALVEEKKVNASQMLDVARALYDLQYKGIVPKDDALMKAINANGVKAW